MRNLSSLGGVTFLAGVVASVCSMGAFAAPRGASLQPPRSARQSAAQKAAPAGLPPAVSEHVYVQDPTAATLFRFPVIHGVMAQQPDATLSTPLNANGVAVASDGTIYIADSRHQSILIYRPGASGQEKPQYRIPLPRTPYELAVQPNGYVFSRLTDDSGVSEIAVISPQRRLVNLIDDEAASSVALDPEGNLYAGNDGGFNVYANPDSSPTLIRSACLGTVNIAVSSNDRLFVSRGRNIVRVNDTLDSCPVRAGRFTLRVVVSPGLYLPYLAAGDHQLFTVEPYNKRVTQVDPDLDRPQHPIAVVQLAAFRYPYAIAVGP